MKATLIISLTVLCLAGCATKEVRESAVWTPKNGFVPDEKTAIAIAVAVWTPIYGEKQIADQKPYSAELKEGVWYVLGYLPPTMLGGVAQAEISKRDGKILSITHGQ